MSKAQGSVVVGYDGSPVAEAALRWAAVEAARRGEPLVVLVATNDVGQMIDFLPSSGGRGGSLQEEGERLAGAGADVARVASPSVQVEPSVNSRGAVAALCEAAQEASLVVVGSSGHGRVMHALLGSVAFAVVTHSEASVVAVRGDDVVQPGSEHPVVVGVDGSAGSDAAVDYAADVASETGAELLLVSAWETPRLDHWSRVYLADDEWRKEDIEHARNNAHSIVRRARARVRERHSGLTVREVVREGRPEQVIAHVHDDTALVVVGARGRGDYLSLLLGSVSRGVVHHARCPVAIIR